MNLTRLIYSSIAFPGIEFSVLRDMLFVSENNNFLKDVTGALSYGGGSFLQILEGDRSEISRLYNIIINDKRHSEIELVEVVPIQIRDFANWSMRYVHYDEKTNPDALAEIKKITTTEKFTPRFWTADQCRAVLLALSAMT